MKWIGQNIYDYISRFRNDVYLEGISTSTETDMLVVDSNNKVSKRAIDAITVDVSDFMTNGSDNRILTATGTDAMNAEANLTFDGTAFSCTADTVTFTSANTDDPAFIIQNTTNDDQGARLQFIKNRGVDGVDDDSVGEIEFWSYDDGTPSLEMYGKIVTKIHDATSGEESGEMRLNVASHDGSTRTGLILTGGGDGEANVEIGRGAASVTDIQGTLSMGGTAAMTNAGLLSVASQTNVTSLGTLTKLVMGGSINVTPGDGAMIHVDSGGQTITDSNTSASGTANKYTHVNIEGTRLAATNASVTTTDAASLYIDGPPVAGTNQTITNPWALWVDAGNARFDGDIDLEGDMDVNGTLETDALTIGGTTVAAIGTSSITTLGTIGTGVWQGTAIASAYLDADTAHNSLTKQMTHHVFVDDMGTTKQYVGLLEADAENTNTANKNLPFPAIVAGKLLKVALRSNKNLTGHTLTWRLESIGAANPNSATPDILGTQSGAGCNNTTMTTYDFTSSLDSGANAFDASDLVYLSIQSDTDFGNNVIYYITCLWEWDLS